MVRPVSSYFLRSSAFPSEVLGMVVRPMALEDQTPNPKPYSLR